MNFASRKKHSAKNKNQCRKKYFHSFCKNRIYFLLSMNNNLIFPKSSAYTVFFSLIQKINYFFSCHVGKIHDHLAAFVAKASFFLWCHVLPVFMAGFGHF